MDISSLEARYLECCRRHEVLPNSAVLSWLAKAKVQKSLQNKSGIVVLLNQLKDADVPPLIDVFLAPGSSDIDAIDILSESPCNLNRTLLLSLLRVIKLKLRVVDLCSMPLEEDFCWDLCYHGLDCQILSLRFTQIQKLNMVGSFERLHTLNLDFCTSITSLDKDCFSFMPNLMCLSMCATRISNLWTTAAALSKLPSLVELRFQNCLCCNDTRPCRSSFPEKLNYADANEASISSCLQRIGLSEVASKVTANLNERAPLQNEIQDKDDFLSSVCTSDLKNEATTLKNYISPHPSPICFEKQYREYIVASLLRLEVLDNIPIRRMDREIARTVFAKYYEYLPYSRQRKENIVNILQKREMRTIGVCCSHKSKPMKLYPDGNSPYFFWRSLCAAKVGFAACPQFHTLSSFGHVYKEENKRLRPRQFEYHPSDSRLMAFGTLDGEVVIINHENGKLVGYVASSAAMNSILGLCWLKKHPSKLLAGSDNGCLKLFDINHLMPEVAGAYCSARVDSFDDFEQLTSVHVNSTDEWFLASGYSKDVALYDISSGKRLQLFANLHREPINVAKFSNLSPFTFATSSFDHDVKLWDLRQKPEQPCYTATSSRGNVMVCFSPDDLYLLVSAVDNEVRQLLAVDGRPHINFEISSTGNSQNYTRSYYMNGRDYIISGSCDEHMVRVCCAQTGRRFRDVHLEVRHQDSECISSLSVQSLRGDPHWPFHMSVLAASKHLSSKRDIIKVNLLASDHYAEEYSFGREIHSSCDLGG